MESKKRPSRLKNRADFEYLKKNGYRISAPSWIIANYCKNKGQGLRVGWTVPGYVGTAVVRNRLKRWIRVDIQTLPDETIKLPVDMNLVFKRKSESFYREIKHGVLTSALKEIFKQLATKRI